MRGEGGGGASRINGLGGPELRGPRPRVSEGPRVSGHESLERSQRFLQTFSPFSPPNE